jgi:hypothetical protein
VLAQVAGLISLPRLSNDTALVGALLLGLLAFIVGARAVLAYQALTRRAAAGQRLGDRLETRQPTIAGSFGRLRGRAAELNVDIERALWALPRFDARLAGAQQELADVRLMLDELGREDGRHIRETVARIRGTLTLLGTASEMRRKFRG